MYGITYVCERVIGRTRYSYESAVSSEDAKLQVYRQAMEDGNWEPPQLREKAWQFWLPAEYSDFDLLVMGKSRPPSIGDLQAEIERLKKALQETRDCLDDEPDYHSQGMGCGLEDRGIRDRYDAMAHGWDKAMERVFGENIAGARDVIDEALREER